MLIPCASIMGRFSQKYTDHQRRAVALAILDGVPGVVGRAKDGSCTAPQAIELAQAGQLPGLEPFDMHLQTARHYATAERRRRAEQEAEKLRDGVGGILDGVALDLARLAQRQARALQRAADGGKLDVKRAQEVARLVQEARKAAGQAGAPKGTGGGAADQPNGDTGQGAGLLSTLAAQERLDGARAAPSTSAQPANQHGAQPAQQDAEPVSSGAQGLADPLALARAVLSGPPSGGTVAASVADGAQSP